MSSFERAQGLVRTRRMGLLAAYLVYSVAGVAPIIYAVTARGLPPMVQVLCGVGYIAGLVGLALWWQKSWHHRRGRVTADARGVFVNGALVAARAKLKHAYVLKHEGRTYLRLVRPGLVVRPHDVEVEDEAEAQAILNALRLDAQSSVAHFVFTAGTAKSDRRKIALLGSYFAATMIASLGIFLAGTAPHSFAGLWPIAFVLYVVGSVSAIMAMKARQANIAVGADGIHLRQFLGTPRFISFRDLEDASIEKKDISLRLKSGEVVTVHHLGEGRPELGTDREREGAGLVARIRDALATYRAAPTTLAHALGRGGRSATEWLSQARALREDAANYRAATIPDEQLWRIVEDAAATPADRAGAALALRQGLDDTGKKRLRVAAEACAENRLRVVLQSATSDDDAALVEALEPLADEAPARRMAI